MRSIVTHAAYQCTVQLFVVHSPDCLSERRRYQYAYIRTAQSAAYKSTVIFRGCAKAHPHSFLNMSDAVLQNEHLEASKQILAHEAWMDKQQIEYLQQQLGDCQQELTNLQVAFSKCLYDTPFPPGLAPSPPAPSPLCSAHPCRELFMLLSHVSACFAGSTALQS